jgi:sugar phosphate isomerase/epimerase
LIRSLREIGIARVQLALDPLRDNPAVWGSTADQFKRDGVAILSGMFGTVGEDYSTLETFHAGFLPHEESDPDFQKLLGRILQIADLFATKGIDLGFETGQETADTLAAFLKKLNRPNVGVNLDPANMLLYDKGNPIDALRTLGPWLKQCHLKDANRTKVPGTWGEEVTVGTGQVDWPAFFQTLGDLRFTGNLCIEREAGSQRVTDILAARQHVEKVLAAR